MAERVDESFLGIPLGLPPSGVTPAVASTTSVITTLPNLGRRLDHGNFSRLNTRPDAFTDGDMVSFAMFFRISV